MQESAEGRQSRNASFTSFFEDVIPRYMDLGMTEGMLHAMIVENQRRILAVQ